MLFPICARRTGRGRRHRGIGMHPPRQTRNTSAQRVRPIHGMRKRCALCPHFTRQRCLRSALAAFLRKTSAYPLCSARRTPRKGGRLGRCARIHRPPRARGSRPLIRRRRLAGAMETVLCYGQYPFQRTAQTNERLYARSILEIYARKTRRRNG